MTEKLDGLTREQQQELGFMIEEKMKEFGVIDPCNRSSYVLVRISETEEQVSLGKFVLFDDKDFTQVQASLSDHREGKNTSAIVQGIRDTSFSAIVGMSVRSSLATDEFDAGIDKAIEMKAGVEAISNLVQRENIA